MVRTKTQTDLHTLSGFDLTRGHPHVVEDVARFGAASALAEFRSFNFERIYLRPAACRQADRAIFLEKGEVRFEGPAQELLERNDLARAVFFGTEGG